MKNILSIIIILLITTLVATAQEDVPFGEEPTVLSVEVINVYEHDSDAFTQGLLIHEGEFYESAGRYGQSTLRRVEIETGEVLQSIELDEEYFAEGLELVGDQLIQLTWQEETAFVYDLETFEQTATFTYETEGWGICSNDEYLYVSDGSSFIHVRDIETFELIFSGLVTIQGQRIQPGLLNELECVGDVIYANLWQTDFIAVIDIQDGHVMHFIDAAELLSEEERTSLQPGATLNGIAYNPESDTFFITGKLWPKMFEVRFIEGTADN